jgi:hypothetical protein
MRHQSIQEGSLLFLLGSVLLCLLPLLAACADTGQVQPLPTATAPAATACKQQTFETGVVYPQWSPKGYGRTDLKWLTQVAAIRKQTSACWLEMPVLFFQDTLSSTELKPGISTATVENFTYGVHFARQLGFHVFVSPLVNVNGPNSWVGSVHFGTYEEEQQWFENYWKIIKPYVKAAQQEGVEQLAIGTEEELLQTNARDEPLWNHLIANIRTVFSGTLTYDMNWSGLGTKPPAWMLNPELKMIGVSGYLSLVDTPTHVDPAQVADLWKQKAQPQLDNFISMLGKPIFLSEVGFRNTPDALYQVWNPKSTGPVDTEEQAAACDAVLVNIMANPQILGSFFWGWDEVDRMSLRNQQPAINALHNRYAPLQS